MRRVGSPIEPNSQDEGEAITPVAQDIASSMPRSPSNAALARSLRFLRPRLSWTSRANFVAPATYAAGTVDRRTGSLYIGIT